MSHLKIPAVTATKHYLGYGSLIYALFAFVYGGTNWLASKQQDFFHFYFDWELNTPFYPGWIYIYLSMSLFFLLPLFVNKMYEITSLLWGFIAVIMMAGILCALLPTEAGAIRPTVVKGYEAAFELLYLFDLPHNLFPSLHVSLTTLCMLVLFFPLKGSLWLFPVVLWWAAMLVSVLFVHQHYLLDILGGLFVAAVCYKYVYLRLCENIIQDA